MRARSLRGRWKGLGRLRRKYLFASFGADILAQEQSRIRQVCGWVRYGSVHQSAARRLGLHLAALLWEGLRRPPLGRLCISADDADAVSRSGAQAAQPSIITRGDYSIDRAMPYRIYRF